jgi:hypothetical protein
MSTALEIVIGRAFLLEQIVLYPFLIPRQFSQRR